MANEAVIEKRFNRLVSAFANGNAAGRNKVLMEIRSYEPIRLRNLIRFHYKGQKIPLKHNDVGFLYRLVAWAVALESEALSPDQKEVMLRHREQLLKKGPRDENELISEVSKGKAEAKQPTKKSLLEELEDNNKQEEEGTKTMKTKKAKRVTDATVEEQETATPERKAKKTVKKAAKKKAAKKTVTAAPKKKAAKKAVKKAPAKKAVSKESKGSSRMGRPLTALAGTFTLSKGAAKSYTPRGMLGIAVDVLKKNPGIDIDQFAELLNKDARNGELKHYVDKYWRNGLGLARRTLITLQEKNLVTQKK